MPTVVLKANTAPQKFAVVTVWNSDRTINREFKISGAAYRALALPGAGAPPGVTPQEWESGRAVAVGKDFDVGDIEVSKDGSAQLKVAEQIAGGRIRELYLFLAPGEFTGLAPMITVAPATIAAIDQRGNLVQIVSVTNGVVTWQ